MHSDSDTESEHESHTGCNDGAFGSLRLSRSAFNTSAREDITDCNEFLRDQDALSAIEQIKGVDVCTICQDIDTQDTLHNAYSAIIGFLDDACAIPFLGNHSAKALAVFTHLADESFLSILFIHRQAFQTTIHSMSHAPPSAMVWWLDVALAKLGYFVLNVAAGFSPSVQAPFLEYMRLHLEEDAVRAAAQLPEKWQSMINTIASNTTSPATRRLALRLLFGAYVMVPQLTGSNPWVDVRLWPEPIMYSLIRISNPRSLNGLPVPSLHRYDVQERTDIAMIVSLFSAWQIAQSTFDPNAPSLLMRPRSLGSILDMIQFIMHQLSAAFSWLSTPYPDLDLAQTVLMRWGSLVPWSWSLWDDQHTAGLECITSLTIAWLYNSHLPFFSTDMCPSPANQLGTLIASNEASPVAILQVLHQINAQLQEAYNPQLHENISPPLTLVLCKSCWATIHLLRLNIGTVQRRVPEFCQSLLSLFCILREAEGELKVKTLVLEALTMIAPRTLAMCLMQVQRDISFGFDLKLVDAIVRSESTLRASFVSPLSLLGVKCLVDFITVLWHSRAGEAVFQTTFFPLLKSALTFLKNQCPNSYASLILRDTLLVAISAFSGSCPRALDDVKLLQDWLVQSSLVHSECSNFIAASGVAQYILADRSDTLRRAEAWDYLRDVLLVILGRRFAEENEALALLISPTICLALARVADVNSSALQFLLSSPWTMSLCTELRSLLGPPKQWIAPYFVALHHRLSSVGNILLNKFTPRPQGTADTTDSCLSESNLVFCCVYPCSRLVLITQI